jgi:hypothetical protein
LSFTTTRCLSGKKVNSMTTFGTFWAGPRLSAFEAACLHSFVLRGHPLTLFSFERVEDVPEGVSLANAQDIVDASSLPRFLINGKPSLSHFSDYFRYVMFSKTDLVWIDTDVMMLADFDHDPRRNLLAREDARTLCTAVMRIGSDDPSLPTLIRQTEALMDTRMRWGATGPRLLTQVCGPQLVAASHRKELFFPVHYDEFWKVFVPEHFDECKALCKEAYTLHLWNNIVERLGFWKDLLPPEGSFLRHLFVENGSQKYFRSTFPAANMHRLVENWLAGRSGSQLGIGSVVRQMVPSVGRTVRHYVG